MMKNERAVNLAKHEAKKRTRSGQAKSYMVALAQLAAENGHANWEEYRKVLEASPMPIPDYRVRLVSSDGHDKTVSVLLKDVLTFHGVSADIWEQEPVNEQQQYVNEYALWSRHKLGDFTAYTAAILEANVKTDSFQEVAKEPQQSQAAVTADMDFIVELEIPGSGKKESIGVLLSDVLELHGLSQEDWRGSGRLEQGTMVEDAALWSKRSKGDLTRYFTEVIRGFDEGDEENNHPR